MVSTLNSGALAPGLSPVWGYYIVFLGETLYSLASWLKTLPS